MLGTVMHRNDGPILGKQAEHLKKLVTFKTIPVFIWSDFLITIHWGSEYQTSEWQTFISPVFRSSIIQMPCSYSDHHLLKQTIGYWTNFDHWILDPYSDQVLSECWTVFVNYLNLSKNTVLNVNCAYMKVFKKVELWVMSNCAST